MHGYEIEFVFGRPFNTSLGYTDEEREMSMKMMQTWTTFARTGWVQCDDGGVQNSDVQIDFKTSIPPIPGPKLILICMYVFDEIFVWQFQFELPKYCETSKSVSIPLLSANWTHDALLNLNKMKHSIHPSYVCPCDFIHMRFICQKCQYGIGAAGTSLNATQHWIGKEIGGIERR